MPLETSWLSDKRVIYLRIYGKVTGGHIDEAIIAQQQQYADGIAPVHMIIDIHPATISIPSLTQVRQRGMGKRSTKTGWVVLINTPNKLVAFTVSLLIQLNNIKEYKNVHTLDEAVEFLNHNDPTLMLDLESARAYVDGHTRET